MSQEPQITFGVDFSKGRDHSVITKCTMLGDVCCIVEATCEEFAAAYVDCLYSPPNGWGQHVMPGFGQSHAVMAAGAEHFGNEAFQKAVSLELVKRRTSNADQS